MAQHLDALQRANDIRLAMVQVRREVAAGQLSIPDAVDDDRAQRMLVRALLSAQVRWGATRTGHLLRQLMIGEHRKVGELTERQHDALVAAFTTPAAATDPAAPRSVPLRRVPAGMEPDRQDARVVTALLKGPATRVELGLRIREMRLGVEDVDACLRRLCGRGAVVLCAQPKPVSDWCPRCKERTALHDAGTCLWCSARLVAHHDDQARRGDRGLELYTVRSAAAQAA